ncbi:hypothetical protein IWQ61_004769 [Dispira simplex]|nr:hypothetical protein IWQ61_004769 [Dispira simplex]
MGKAAKIYKRATRKEKELKRLTTQMGTQGEEARITKKAQRMLTTDSLTQAMKREFLEHRQLTTTVMDTSNKVSRKVGATSVNEAALTQPKPKAKTGGKHRARKGIATGQTDNLTTSQRDYVDLFTGKKSKLQMV